ncbi:MAG TPA: GntR family transcriptional regulator [Bacillota bacterium]|nr:GntR family transcriptional regulator [Bacillota bacterium]
MILQTDGQTPIYIQIAHWLETQILTGAFIAHEKVYSQYQLADMLQINPATAAKGLNVLAAEGILYDKRGLGKFVSEDAKRHIKEKRKDGLLHELMEQIVEEALYLDVSKEELTSIVENVYQEKRDRKNGSH